jgi:hypothetical protein
MKVAVAFEKPVYKDQGTPADVGQIIEPLDVVTVAIRNAAGVETAQDLTVTDVLYGGTTIQFETPVGGLTLRAEDIVRVHAKHQYFCPTTTDTYVATLTEGADADTVKAKVTSLVLLGAPRSVGVEEVEGPAVGFSPEFAGNLQTKINEVLNGHGYATVTSPTATTIVITISGLTAAPGAFVVAGLTAGAWA